MACGWEYFNPPRGVDTSASAYRNYYGSGGTAVRHDRLHQVSHVSWSNDHVFDVMNYYGVNRFNRARHRVNSSILATDHEYYSGLDRFARVKNEQWGSGKSQIQHTYDYAAIRLSRDVAGTTARSQVRTSRKIRRSINWGTARI